MTAGYALNIERLYGSGIIRAAAKHNLREIAAEIGADGHIDAARIADNFILRGPSTAKEVAALAKSLMEAAGVLKCRKGAVTALELLFTLPAATTIDPRQYFEQAICWAEQHFSVPVLSCVQHADEGSPHAHALLLPLVDGRMGGSDLHGGKAKLAAMQTSFHEAIGAPHGLPKYAPQKRLSAPVRAAAMALARETLQANAALNDDIIDALLVPHTKDPAPLLQALGIAMPEPKPKSKDFVSIMVSVCKPEKRSHIGKADHRPIGKAIQAAPVMSLPDTCVGKALPTTPNPPDFQRQQAATDTAKSATTDQQHATNKPASASPAPTSAPTAPVKAASSKPATKRAGRPASPATLSPSCTAMPGVQDAPTLDVADHHQPLAKPVRADLERQQDEQRPPAAVDDYQRQHDDDQPAEHWNPDLGEFLGQAASRPAPRRRPGRAAHAPSNAPSMPQALPEARASPAGIAIEA